jgi:hypothetical protein
MSPEDVNRLFGEPFTVGTTADGLEIRYYGCAKFWADSEVWLSVAFDNSEAARVFSDDFFDREIIRATLRRKNP